MSDDFNHEALPIGSEVGGYIIRKVLGQGGFGITYAASSATGMVERSVAIKEFFPHGLAYREDKTVTLSSRIDKVAYDAALRRFEAEARKLVDVYDHPNIVRGENVVHAYGSVFLIMEYVDGVMLQDWVTARGGLPEAEVRQLLQPVFEAVVYLHAAQAMHRDLSPRNIMIRTKRRGQQVIEPVVIDFGAIGDGLDLVHDSTIAVANPLYSPPEQQEPQGVAQGRFTDVFALGGCVYFTATGKPPVKPMTRLAATAHGQMDPLPPVGSLVANRRQYSQAFFEGVDRALRLDPRARPATVEALSSLLGWSTIDPDRRDATTIVAPGQTGERRFVRRSRAGLWIGTGAGVAAAAGAAILFGPQIASQFSQPSKKPAIVAVTPALSAPIVAPAPSPLVTPGPALTQPPPASASPAIEAPKPVAAPITPTPLPPPASEPAVKPEPEPPPATQEAVTKPEPATPPTKVVVADPPASTPVPPSPATVSPPAETPPATPPNSQPTATSPTPSSATPPTKIAVLDPAGTAPTAPAPVKPAPVETPVTVISVPPPEPPAKAPEPLTVPQLALQYASLSPDGGVVARPHTAADVYHNARFHEQRGEALAARQAYLELARFDVDAVDAWTRFATVLRVQDGRAGARDVFAELAPSPRSLAYDLVAATLYDDVQRRQRIEAFVEAHSGYGPAWYLLADELSEARLGSQTLNEKHRESEALAKFLAADEEGELVRHFMDPIMLGDWIDTARRRKTALDAILARAQSTPAAIFSRSNAGWTVTVQLPEPAIGFAYRLGSSGTFKTADATQSIDSRTGKPFPNTLISIGSDQEPSEIDIRYTDLRGVDVGPFPIAFDPAAALIQQIKQTLNMTKGAWVAFGGQGSPLMYMTHLASYVCGIEKASFGLDGNPADRPLPLPTCNPKEPYAIPSNFQPYLKVPATTKSATVRVVFKDGTSEETVIMR
jgi:serine/threonine protein kinase